MRKHISRLAVLLAVLCAGCVDGDVRTFVKYDRADDSFHCMQVYANLVATDSLDLDHMKALWERREAIIINPGQINIFSTLAYERKGRYKFRPVELGIAATQEQPVLETRVDLDSIKVIPGEFYLNAHGNLSYYQRSVVPGKTLDAILEEVTPKLAEDLAKFAEGKLAPAGPGKARRSTWESVRKRILEQLTEKDNPEAPKPKDDDEDMVPLEMASLKLLARAGTDKSLKLTRKQDVFTLLLPLSKTDCDEAVATVELIRTTLNERTKAGKPVEEGIAAGLKAIKVRSVDGAGLELTADISLLMKAIGPEGDPTANPNKAAAYKSTIAAIEGRGVAVNRKFSIQKLVAEFVGK